jgi:hypothetical protein
MEHAPELTKGHAYYPALDGLWALCIVFTAAARRALTAPWFVSGKVGGDNFFPLGNAAVGLRRFGRRAPLPWR